MTGPTLTADERIGAQAWRTRAIKELCTWGRSPTAVTRFAAADKGLGLQGQQALFDPWAAWPATINLATVIKPLVTLAGGFPISASSVNALARRLDYLQRHE